MIISKTQKKYQIYNEYNFRNMEAALNDKLHPNIDIKREIEQTMNIDNK